MSDTLHNRVHEQDLIVAALTDDGLAALPPDIRAHLVSCDECSATLRLMREVRTGLAGTDPSADLSPPLPSTTRATLAERAATPLSWVADAAPSFEDTQYRDLPLELVQSDLGVRAWDPDAQHLMLYRAQPGAVPLLIGRQDSDTPGVGLHIDLVLDDPCDLVAFATRDLVHRAEWDLWLGDLYRNGEPDPSAFNDPRASHIHVRRIRATPPVSQSRIRIRPDAMPQADEATTSLLKRGAAAGRAEDTAEAVRCYRQAMMLAKGKRDASGEIKAALGYALAIGELGYEADADRVLKDLVRRQSFDAKLGALTCRLMVYAAAQRGEAGEARAWVAECHRLEPDESPLLRLQRVLVAALERDHDGLVALTEDLGRAEVSEAARVAMALDRVCALVQVGRLVEAQELLLRTGGAKGGKLEQFFRRTRATALIERARHRVDWSELCQAVSDRLQEHDERPLSRTNSQQLMGLVELAFEGGHLEEAALLMRLRFLHTLNAVDERVELFGMAQTPSGVFMLRPGGEQPLVRLHLGAPAVREHMLAIRREVQSGDAAGPRRESLREHLGGKRALSGAGHLLVASDGLLDDLPVRAMLADTGRPLSHVTGVRRLRASRAMRPNSSLIASLADAFLDLPAAAAEVPAERCHTYLRGGRATSSALRQLGRCGLLHLGVHAVRELGTPCLLLADGPLGPDQVEALPLQDAPVVLLTGCATAAQGQDRGVETSLAGAFQVAGASAVVGTRWPVRDEEMKRFVQELLASWPFDDAAQAVALAAERLRRRGAPPRLWAAPVVS